MAKLECDILIVGAGPAGVMAAAWASKLGYSVILTDKHLFPRDKICGDLMPPMCMQLINEIDSSFSYRNFDSVLIQNLFFRNESDSYEVNLPDTVQCISSPRKIFDNALLDLIKEKVRFLQQATLQQVNNTGTDISASFMVNNESLAIKCNYLIGADGANSNIRKQIFPHLSEGIEHAIAVRCYADKKAELKSADSFFTESARPGYYWLFPSVNNTVNAGILLPPNTESTKSRNQLLDSFINGHSAVGTQHSMISWTVPTLVQQQPVAHHGYFLIGDAAGLCEPIFAHGIDIAMLSAKLCIQAIYNERLSTLPQQNACSTYAQFIAGYMVPKFVRANEFKNSSMTTEFSLNLLYNAYVETMVLNTNL